MPRFCSVTKCNVNHWVVLTSIVFFFFLYCLNFFYFLLPKKITASYRDVTLVFYWSFFQTPNITDGIFLFREVVILNRVKYLLLNFLKYFRSRLETVQVYAKHALAGSPACRSSCCRSELIPLLQADILSIHSWRKINVRVGILCPLCHPSCSVNQMDLKGKSGTTLGLGMSTCFILLVWPTSAFAELALDVIARGCPIQTSASASAWGLLNVLMLSVALGDPENWTGRAYTSKKKCLNSNSPC